jgi:hypothetical protein
MYRQRSSNHIRLIPVSSKDGAAINLEVGVINRNDERDLNSNLVERIMTPKNFKTSPAVVITLFASPISCWSVEQFPACESWEHNQKVVKRRPFISSDITTTIRVDIANG